MVGRGMILLLGQSKFEKFISVSTGYSVKISNPKLDLIGYSKFQTI